MQEDLRDMLKFGLYCYGYGCSCRRSSIAKNTPDLLLLDITLRGKEDGIHLAACINENQKIPFVFLTSHSDTTTPTVERAKSVNPAGYLVKPFEENDVDVAIEIALSNWHKLVAYKNMVQKEDMLNDSISLETSV